MKKLAFNIGIRIAGYAHSRVIHRIYSEINFVSTPNHTQHEHCWVQNNLISLSGLKQLCLEHRVNIFTRDETGLLYQPTEPERTLQLYYVRKGGGLAPLTLTSLGKFYPRDGMYARNRLLLLCVLCGLEVFACSSL